MSDTRTSTKSSHWFASHKACFIYQSAAKVSQVSWCNNIVTCVALLISPKLIHWWPWPWPLPPPRSRPSRRISSASTSRSECGARPSPIAGTDGTWNRSTRTSGGISIDSGDFCGSCGISPPASGIRRRGPRCSGTPIVMKHSSRLVRSILGPWIHYL